MLFPWYGTAMLAIESSCVMALRSVKLAAGGREALFEAELMVSEKIDALIETGISLCGGGTPTAIVARYREHVAANAVRLGNAEADKDVPVGFYAVVRRDRTIGAAPKIHVLLAPTHGAIVVEDVQITTRPVKPYTPVMAIARRTMPTRIRQ